MNTADGEKKANFADLDPEVDTMTVGKTELQLALEDEVFGVTVVVEDTNKPVINGAEDVIELEGEEVDVEKELKKMITAEDPVDGELEVILEIKEKENKENEYNITATAIDENENKTTEKFEVVVKIIEKKEEKEEKEESNESPSNSNSSSSSNSISTEKSSRSNNSSSSSSNSGKNNAKAEPEKPQPQPKPETKPTPQPQPEPKPEPKPSPSLPTLGKPVSSVPSGASIRDSGVDYDDYSYNKSLPGGGKITRMLVSAPSHGGVSVLVEGVDNAGNSFIGNKSSSGGGVNYMFSEPIFGNDDYLDIDVATSQFLTAYGY